MKHKEIFKELIRGLFKVVSIIIAGAIIISILEPKQQKDFEEKRIADYEISDRYITEISRMLEIIVQKEKGYVFLTHEKVKNEILGFLIDSNIKLHVEYEVDFRVLSENIKIFKEEGKVIVQIPKSDIVVSNVAITNIETTENRSILGPKYTAIENSHMIMSLTKYIKRSVEKDKVLRVFAEDNCYYQLKIFLHKAFLFNFEIRFV